MAGTAVIEPQSSVRRVVWGSTLAVALATIIAIVFLIGSAFPCLLLDQQRLGPYWPCRNWLLLPLYHVGL